MVVGPGTYRGSATDYLSPFPPSVGRTDRGPVDRDPGDKDGSGFERYHGNSTSKVV